MLDLLRRLLLLFMAVLFPSTASSHIGTAIETGTASFVAPSYGADYLALPQGPGLIVTICSPLTCVTRTSNDTGPVAALHRVADLSFADFRSLCGCDPWVKGTMTVTVEFGQRAALPTPPATSTQ